MTSASYPVDSISILFLSLMRKEHTNLFRFAMTLEDPISPELLQQAVDSIWKRFPSMVACIKPSFFAYRLVHAAQPPKVQPDPGLLKTMSAQELQECAFRVYYQDCTISVEMFHALSDGHGAIIALTTLVAEYLQRKQNLLVPATENRLDVTQPPSEQEVEDSFLALADAKPWHIPSRFSYLPPRPEDTDWRVRYSAYSVETRQLLEAAHRHGVTLNTLLSAVLARSVMRMQLRRKPARLKPVRIMIPVNLRRMFGSRTLRNFTLYGLPAMEAGEKDLSLTELCQSFEKQIKNHFSREKMEAMSAYNVRTQDAWFFRYLPWKLKAALMRIGYRFFGESNSSLTLTNLGNVRLPEALQSHVKDLQVYLTPRAGVPYGCSALSYGDTITLNLTKFTDDTELEDLFFGSLKDL